MTKALQVIAMLLLLATGFTGTAMAQDFGEEGPPPQTSEPAPAKTVRKAYENGGVIVIITAPLEEYGFRLGTRIPLEVDFVVRKGVELKLDNLIQGNFDPAAGSDFRLLNVQQLPVFEQDGMEVYRVLIEVWSTATFRNGQPSTTWVFNSMFLYSLEKGQDGTPNWKKAMTPDMVLTRSPTAVDNSKNLDEGDLSLRRAPFPASVRPLRWAGAFFGVIFVIFTLRFIWNLLFPPRELPANVRAWQTFDDVLKKSDTNGVTLAEANRLAAALRQYLKVTSLTKDDELKSALEVFFASSNKRYELARKAGEAIAIIDKGLYERQRDGGTHALTAAELRELYRRLELLVPRP